MEIKLNKIKGIIINNKTYTDIIDITIRLKTIEVCYRYENKTHLETYMRDQVKLLIET